MCTCEPISIHIGHKRGWQYNVARRAGDRSGPGEEGFQRACAACACGPATPTCLGRARAMTSNCERSTSRSTFDGFCTGSVPDDKLSLHDRASSHCHLQPPYPPLRATTPVRIVHGFGATSELRPKTEIPIDIRDSTKIQPGCSFFHASLHGLTCIGVFSAVAHKRAGCCCCRRVQLRVEAARVARNCHECNQSGEHVQ